MNRTPTLHPLIMGTEAFESGMTRLVAAFPSFQLSDLTVTVYMEALQEYSAKRFDGATKTAVKECKFFPSVAELIELMRNAPPEYKSIEQLRADQGVS